MCHCDVLLGKSHTSALGLHLYGIETVAGASLRAQCIHFGNVTLVPIIPQVEVS